MKVTYNKKSKFHSIIKENGEDIVLCNNSGCSCTYKKTTKKWIFDTLLKGLKKVESKHIKELGEFNVLVERVDKFYVVCVL